MNLLTEQKAIDTALDDYRAQLDLIPDDLFTVTPPGGGWSYAEVYSHILKATLKSCIAMERCTHSNCEPTKKGLSFWGYYTMLMGSFPPLKIKEPPKVAEKMPAEKISKEEAKNQLIKCRKRIDEIALLVYNSSDEARIKHPRLGVLNARQWLKFIRIHLQHHINQLHRVENKFRAV
ncbi:DinB family protein [Mucilaginibacter sp.]|uniref:DinB family protein n=1 Tax=Mucilaginibacter sp. TaxID=1882438 RepID=UPI003D11E0DB